MEADQVERSREVRALVHMYVIEINAFTLLGFCVILIVFPRSNGLPSGTWEEGHYMMTINCEKGSTTEDNAHRQVVNGVRVDVADCACEV